MSRVLPTWKDYAELADPGEAQEALQDLQDVLALPDRANALSAVDQMLSDVLDKHFRDTDAGELNNLAILDSFENLGRDRFQEDPERGEIPGHFDGGHHRMDSTPRRPAG